ncbi:TolC family protein [Mucilaginibacter sp. X4EP1]|uniref:TolC family protein n=1 Tax=Mucilaginibacter sp. X4EP1 TaxID=2723092 RepID=UPI00216949CE|nr:TolC family protein [Mucilaginibacter sp. X4EP1]MCS3814790.1 outer membrane protein TolC [Mucilaginibacter sp. X4EP1]
MKYKLLIASILCTMALQSQAQQAVQDTGTYNFTVADCVNYAYNHQHDVINANLDVKSAEYHVKEIIGQGLPQVNGSANFFDYLIIPTTLIPGSFIGQQGNVKLKFGVTYQSTLSVTASQILFDPSYIVGLQGRKTYQQLYDRSYTRSKIAASVGVTKAYYLVLVGIEDLKLTQANIDEIKQQMDETIARNKQGVVEKIDVDRIVYQYNSLITSKENTIRTLAFDYQLLKFQMGMPIDRQLTLRDKLEDVQLDATGAEAANDTTVYHQRIEYGLLETQKKLNEYDVKLKKGQFLPKLTANANYSPSYQNNNFGSLYGTNFPSSYVGLSLTVPIFTGFQHSNQLKQSQITVLKSENDLYDMKNNINLQISQARTSYVNGLQTLNDQKKNMALANEILRVSKIKYEQGVGSSIEVTQAQTSVREADNLYIQGLYNALVSKVDLDQAYGRIK